MARTVKKPSTPKITEKTKAPAKSVKTTPAKKPVKLPEKLAAPGTLPLVHADGNAGGAYKYSKDIFETEVNVPLMTQSVRVYLSNQRAGGAMTKTRGNVEGSSRKIFRQKGTGRARHGSVRAPIFVGGGVAFGPHGANYSLDMPRKMRHRALLSSLASQAKKGGVAVIDGMDSLERKTKTMAAVLNAYIAKGSVLLVVDPEKNSFMKSVRNIDGVDIMPVSQLHTYAVLSHVNVLFTDAAMEKISIT